MPKDKTGGETTGGKKGGGGKTTASAPEGAILGTEFDDLVSLSGPILSTDGDDIIWSLDGNDEIYAGAGNDTVNAGAGDDVYYDGAGSDVIDGGDGFDRAIYYGDGSNLDIVEVTEVQGKGKNAQTVITGFTVLNTDTGEMDTYTNYEQILVLDLPTTGDIITQGDGLSTVYTDAVSFDPLANDYLEGGAFGAGLTITAVTDFQIDLDNDGVNDVDLIPDGAVLADYLSGVTLNDGSVLTLNPDDTFTWDPNGAYPDAPTGTDPTPSIQFWYEVTDGAGNFDYGDVTIQVLHPVAPGATVGFETLTLFGDDHSRDWLGLWEYLVDDGTFKVSQGSNGLTTFYPYEERDAGTTDFDYDGDGDNEFRVWTDGDGTTHEMVLSDASGDTFDLGGFTITGLDAGETVRVTLTRSDFTIATVDVTSADLTGDVLEFTNATDVLQLNVEALEAGAEFFIDDVFTV